MLIAQDYLLRDVEYWLSSSVLGARQRNTNEGSVIWINACYESAESYYLYPERKHGRVYLEVTLDAGCRHFYCDQVRQADGCDAAGGMANALL